ncbi:hypothetical protein D7V83_04925 [bacterium 0.1xD8-71]|nr:hypothetical protein D7V83_04925 [bacterium 0.1xD8-71]
MAFICRQGRICGAVQDEGKTIGKVIKIVSGIESINEKRRFMRHDSNDYRAFLLFHNKNPIIGYISP